MTKAEMFVSDIWPGTFPLLAAFNLLECAIFTPPTAPLILAGSWSVMSVAVVLARRKAKREEARRG